MYELFNDPNDPWQHIYGNDPIHGNTDDERQVMQAGCFQLVAMLAFIVVAMALCLLFSSCTTERIVTVERVRTDTTYITKHQRDSVWLHDSTFVKVAGDTVWIERWHTKWQIHLEHDTIYRSRVDSVPVPYPVVKEVEKPLSKTEKGLMVIGLLSLLGAIVAVAWKIKKFLPW